MQLRTFSARGSAAVLAMIKDELGPDAVILDTQEEDGVVTITAATDRIPKRPKPAAPPPGARYDAARGAAAGAVSRAAPGLARDADRDDRAAEMDAELFGNGARRSGHPASATEREESVFQDRGTRRASGTPDGIRPTDRDVIDIEPDRVERKGGKSRESGGARDAGGRKSVMPTAEDRAAILAAAELAAVRSEQAARQKTEHNTGRAGNDASERRRAARAEEDAGRGSAPEMETPLGRAASGRSPGRVARAEEHAEPERPASARSRRASAGESEERGERAAVRGARGQAAASGDEETPRRGAFAPLNGGPVEPYGGGGLEGGFTGAARNRRDDAEAPALRDAPGWREWHEEWNSIKTHILALMKPALRLDQLAPRQRLAIEFLQREGVEDDAVLNLFQRLRETPDASILNPLGQLVPIQPLDMGNWPQRIQCVGGPFGVGKTSVAIRMAMARRKINATSRICLVNADATRGNGRLLLKHYCELSEFGYKEATTTVELVAALNAAEKERYDHILVDLPGLSRGKRLAPVFTDAGLNERIGDDREDVALHTILSPHYSMLQLRGILERYRTPHAGSVIWTKLDEAEHFGQIVNVGFGTGLPISALSFGPGLGNTLVPVKETMLWRLLFKRELPVAG